MQSAALHYEDRRSVESCQEELEDSKLGMALIAALRIAREIDDRAAKAEAAAVLNGRRYAYRPTLEQRLAEALLNCVGEPDDCFMIRQFAEAEAER